MDIKKEYRCWCELAKEDKDLTIEFLKPIKVKKKEDLTEDNERLMKIITKKLEEKRN